MGGTAKAHKPPAHSRTRYHSHTGTRAYRLPYMVHTPSTPQHPGGMRLLLMPHVFGLLCPNTTCASTCTQESRLGSIRQSLPDTNRQHVQHRVALAPATTQWVISGPGVECVHRRACATTAMLDPQERVASRPGTQIRQHRAMCGGPSTQCGLQLAEVQHHATAPHPAQRVVDRPGVVVSSTMSHRPHRSE